MPLRHLFPLKAVLLMVGTGVLFPQARAAKLSAPPEAIAVLGQIYSGDTPSALESARRMQQEQPDQPLGYLLEDEALWWQIWCKSAEFKWGMTDARRRPKLPSDQHFFELATKVSQLANSQIKQHESAEMHFYAGMGDAMAARLYGLLGETRNTARAGVRARDHFLRALALDPDLADADLGLGLYNYYVDTLSGIAKVLRFFMGIPGGSKQDGVRQIQMAVADGVLVPDIARLYLALNLHRYDRRYEDALAAITPLVEKFPSNPLFQLARGDLLAKLGRKEQALECYRAAEVINVRDPDCAARIQGLVRASLAALGVSTTSPAP
jgi:tetratricopeptide (TPR) repeat protein